MRTAPACRAKLQSLVSLSKGVLQAAYHVGIMFSLLTPGKLQLQQAIYPLQQLCLAGILIAFGWGVVIALPGRPRSIGTDVAHPYVLGNQSQQHGTGAAGIAVQSCRDTDARASTKETYTACTKRRMWTSHNMQLR